MESDISLRFVFVIKSTEKNNLYFYSDMLGQNPFIEQK